MGRMDANSWRALGDAGAIVFGCGESVALERPATEALVEQLYRAGYVERLR